MIPLPWVLGFRRDGITLRRLHRQETELIYWHVFWYRVRRFLCLGFLHCPRCGTLKDIRTPLGESFRPMTHCRCCRAQLEIRLGWLARGE